MFFIPRLPKPATKEGNKITFSPLRKKASFNEKLARRSVNDLFIFDILGLTPSETTDSLRGGTDRLFSLKRKFSEEKKLNFTSKI